MIFDVMTRAWHSPEQLGFELAEGIRNQSRRPGGLDGTIGSHTRAMECVGCALVHGFKSQALSAVVPPEFVADVVSRQPHRLAGVAGIDPMSPSWSDDLDHARSLGLAAVTVSPSAQGFHPTHSNAMRFFDRCAFERLPVFVSRPGILSPAMILEYDRPTPWDEVARTFPALKIIIAEIGAPWIDETIALLSKHPGIYADTSGLASQSWRLYTTLLHAHEVGVLEKIFFGSGFPFASPAAAVEAIYSLNSYALGTNLSSIPRAALRLIVERNPITTLGMTAPLTIGAHATHAPATDRSAFSAGTHSPQR
ncbi:MAG: hypothetical protein EXS15_00510 [Phycisphaerales bacterium]|nr:hypothetical protein [Phycisphaerales bacterium]